MVLSQISGRDCYSPGNGSDLRLGDETETPTAMDIFSGCGGASLGFVLRGFEIVASIDNDASACKTYKANLGGDPIVDDVKEFSGNDLLKQSGMARGETTVVIGCPPCQGFSRLRKQHSDKRNRLIFDFIGIVRQVRPKFVTFENVPGVLEVAGGRYFRQLRSELSSMGYHSVYSSVNAVNYSVPQFRRRVLLLATRLKRLARDLRLPASTHCPPWDARRAEGLDRWMTVRDAIGDLPPIRSGERFTSIANHVSRNLSDAVLKKVVKIPVNGGSRTDLKKSMWLDCHRDVDGNIGFRDVYGRLRWDNPSNTITSGCTNPSKGRFLHPEQDRALSLREAARLQSFPDSLSSVEGFCNDFQFFGNHGEVATQIGNALPVRLGEAIAETISHIRNGTTALGKGLK